ncbi:MAG: hypothetical protein A2275_07400 [Bacteroidetes bacterium RIFOXYA12_FULL_35_11]|nr:MAG: hypothetical protein A2X01_06490 [Bacteroidetes bacterium GWF2_35_48]OFY73073.1 MAG: hypothetical protein A2275_07400 [Bacteroidetes bacterium RIFOXYA12_FULL_35_11]OFY94625.1 MAG: hypothetical protein A2491_08920 [Bacteroidetes bacterium RIFOXYC12_FULL_35_7]OFY97433.1 MAG: hypothetical protein A2309_04065 [Bacteroidetes bacterium RIFOXYB2_FULL_35_7]HBX53528.1 hypothetical protein [Bacteroidales bacterium]
MLKISIITPNYNYAHFIEQTIKSVVEQNYESIEYIIVDDGSKDNSVEIISKYAEKHQDKIRFFPRTNYGLAKTLNFAFKQATGDVIGWLNSDDTLCEGAVKMVMDIFNSKLDTDIVYGNYNLMNQDGQVQFEHKHLKFDYASGVFKGFGNILTSNSFFWKSSLFEKYGYINENFKYNVDGEFFSRITINTKIAQIKKPLANYRQHGATLTSEKNPIAEKQKQKELSFEFENSYKNLKISKIVSLKYVFFLKYYYLSKRIIFRALQGHYFDRIKAKI